MANQLRWSPEAVPALLQWPPPPLAQQDEALRADGGDLLDRLAATDHRLPSSGPVYRHSTTETCCSAVVLAFSAVPSYQYLAVVLAIKRMFDGLGLDYGNLKAWDGPPDREGVDATGLLAFGAYGNGILHLFNPSSAVVNPLDPYQRVAVGARFDVKNPVHLRAVLAEILALYPTQRLLMLASSDSQQSAQLDSDFVADRSPEQHRRVLAVVEHYMADFLDRMSAGLARIAVASQLFIERTASLKELVDLPGTPLQIAAIAGGKRYLLESLLPVLFDLSEQTLPDEVDDSHLTLQEDFADTMERLLAVPFLVDLPSRPANFLIRGSWMAASDVTQLELSRGQLHDQQPALLTVRITNLAGAPVEAPDYGQAVRFRLGGTAVEGIHYSLDGPYRARVLYLPPGASEAILPIQLQPMFFDDPGQFIQLELLGADSGYQVSPDHAVLTLQQPGLDHAAGHGVRSTFRPSLLATETAGQFRLPIIHSAESGNVVLRGRAGAADRFIVRATDSGIPHIESFRPMEGDQLFIDVDTLQQFRSRPENRHYSEQTQALALADLEQILGRDVISALTSTELNQALQPLLAARQPLPAFELNQVEVLGGVLFDLISRRPLALVSDYSRVDGDLAWSSVTDSPITGLLQKASLPTPAQVQIAPGQTLSRAFVPVQDLVSAAAIEAAAERAETLLPVAVHQDLSLPAPLTRMAARVDLTPLLDYAAPAGDLPLRRPGEVPVGFSVAADGQLKAFSYDPITRVGSRFYDTDADQVADLMTVVAEDGGPGDLDRQRNGEVHTTVALAVTPLQPRFQQSVPGVLTIADPSATSTAAAVVLKARLSGRVAALTQIGYVVLDADDLALAAPWAPELNWLQRRGRTLLHALEDRDVTLADDESFTQEIVVRQGQSLRFFAVSDDSLAELTSLPDPRFHWFDITSVEDTLASFSAAGSSAALPSFTLETLADEPGLGALIAQEQDLWPVLDFRAFSGAEAVHGELTLSREAQLDAVTGFYRCFDERGTIRAADGRLLRPGDADYSFEALRSDNIVTAISSLEVADRGVLRQEISLRESSVLAPFSRVGQQTFLAFADANSDRYPHFRMLGSNRFGLEDWLGGLDKDHDDHVLSFQFRTLQF
ncbi:MAG: hypothetical protein VKK62_07500 [Synechococcaceae cyanobacterium]|nr:hypothetical protein [Synechococcaceae cyanobacterium]